MQEVEGKHIHIQTQTKEDHPEHWTRKKRAMNKLQDRGYEIVFLLHVKTQSSFILLLLILVYYRGLN